MGSQLFETLILKVCLEYLFPNNNNDAGGGGDNVLVSKAIKIYVPLSYLSEHDIHLSNSHPDKALWESENVCDWPKSELHSRLLAMSIIITKISSDFNDNYDD